MLKTKFSRELTIVILVKVLLVYSLWKVCFKDNKLHIDGATFAHQVFD